MTKNFENNEIIDCFEAIKSLPAEFVAKRQTAADEEIGDTVAFNTVHAGQAGEYMSLVSPTLALFEHTCVGDPGVPFRIWTIGDTKYRIWSGGLAARGTWKLQRLDNGVWHHGDVYYGARDDFQKLCKSWNRRRRAAIREVKNQTPEQAMTEKQARKLAAITNQKMAMVLKARQLQDALDEFVKSIENDTVTHDKCADIYSECLMVQQAQKQFRRVLGARMPQNNEENEE